jgi:cysteinyl-tRNA synthetase
MSNAIHISDSLTRRKVPFEPINPPEVKMYVCGPTVYDEPHIGHARSAYIFDVIKRYLVYKGYKVKFVRNVTDVDDKIINKAKEEFPSEDLNVSFKKVADKYLKSYHEALESLGIEGSGIIEPKASEYIPKMLFFIQKLIDKGSAYVSGGDVYFDITKAKDYGKLSNQSLEKMESGVRVAPNENKHNPLDFALWKSAKENEPAWDSPWGKGRPGWHIECSVMSSDILGNEFDIHGGGIDLIFPHHENEIAQSEAAGEKFARHWIHHGLLTINGQKMSKSLGNFKTIKDVLKEIKAQDNAKADILKNFYLQAHYSMPIDFSYQSIKDSTEAIYGLLQVLKNGDLGIDNPSQEDNEINSQIKYFESEMSNDFHAANAKTALFGIMRRCNSLLGGKQGREEKNTIQYGVNSIRRLANILGLSLPKLDSHDSNWSGLSVINIMKDVEQEEKEIETQIEQRAKFKREKKYVEADNIRKALEAQGIILEDTKDGKTSWRRKK